VCPGCAGYVACVQVAFKEAEAAARACADATPCIDRRTANCNLASLGLKHSPPHPHPRRLNSAGAGAGGWGRGTGGGRGGYSLHYTPQQPFQLGGTVSYTSWVLCRAIKHTVYEHIP